MDLEKELQSIKERNKKVELDKAWEVSWVRRGFIFVMTYVVAALYFYAIDESVLFLKALIPAVGYIFSTFSLPFVKSWWVRNQK